MRVRKARAEDYEAILRIERVSRRDMGRRRFIKRILDGGACLVAEDEGRVVGYGALEYTFFEQGFIPLVYVAASSRRKGAGSKLLRALSARCKTRKLFTSTNRSNKPMRRLLARLGYVRSGVIENLDPNDPELVYFLDRRARRPRRTHADS